MAAVFWKWTHFRVQKMDKCSESEHEKQGREMMVENIFKFYIIDVQ